ncbi:MAG: PKD domain-containing protein, partial [Candidatus Bathyarchaeota archaeon]
DFTINLVASDDDSGVAETFYRINAGSTRQLGVNGQPLIATEGGTNSLEYWSVDNVGNEEAHKFLTDIKLDKTDPVSNPGQNITVNEDTPINFDGSSSSDNIGISNYRWEFYANNLQTLTGSTPQYTFNTPGNYVVSLIVTDSALNSATKSITVTVLDITDPKVDAGDDVVIHQRDSVIFDGSKSSDNVQILNYKWTFIDGSTKTLVGVSPNYVFNSAGTFIVTLNVSDFQGNSATDTVLVTVVDITFPLAKAGVDQIVDEDTSVTFDGSASSDNVGITSYIWSFSASEPHTLNGENPSYVFEKPGIYLVTLTVSDAEGHSSNDTVTFTVLDKTAPVIETKDFVSGIEDNPISFDASQSYDNVGIANYTWIFGDGSSENSSVPSVSHIFADSNTYDVELDVTDTSGNTNTTYITAEVQRDTDGDLIADQVDEDDDDDGMPDTWELNYGLNPLDPSDASLDSDSDTIINLLEYQQNSNPNSYDFTIYTLAIILVGLGIFSVVILGIHYIRTSKKKIKI